MWAVKPVKVGLWLLHFNYFCKFFFFKCQIPLPNTFELVSHYSKKGLEALFSATVTDHSSVACSSAKDILGVLDFVQLALNF